MEHNDVYIKLISDIIEKKFFYIPSYQRGYRWTKIQVENLLNDIWEFTKDKDNIGKSYCLQPLIVRKVIGAKNEPWEVIDGQQRLTTIFIILNYLNKENIEIGFETKTDSQWFLSDINNQTASKTNIDIYHIYNAYQTIKEWFEEKQKQELKIVEEFLGTFRTSTNFIWYQINNSITDPIEIFTNINIGKIPLTNAELIKALFLQKDNFNSNNVSLSQIEIATAWDSIEYKLQNDDFWYFLGQSENMTDTRIEFIFNLMASNNIDKNDQYSTFNFFNKKFSNGDRQKVVKENWEKIENYFLTLEEWFTDRDLYHYIGYLITYGKNILDLKEASESKTKLEFKKYLKDQIKDMLHKGMGNHKILALNYPDKIIDKLLLLYNIETILNNTENSRFSFHQYKNDKWSLEHIHAQNSKGLDSTEERRVWLDEVLKITSNLKEGDQIDEINQITYGINQMKAKDDIQAEEFEDLQDEIFNIFGQQEDMHRIDNLALLSIGNNSTLNNSIFPVKRQKIIELERRGSFIPICTRNVFLKYHTENPRHLYFWSETDREAYINDILKVLKYYSIN